MYFRSCSYGYNWTGILFGTSYAEASYGNPLKQASSHTIYQREQCTSKQKCYALEISAKCPIAIMILHPERLRHLEGRLQVNEVYFARYEETTVSTHWKHSKSVACLGIIKHARENTPDMKVKLAILSQDSKCLQLWLQFLLAFAKLTFGDGSSD